MPLTHTEAWDDLMRRAKVAGIIVSFNHVGVAVLLMPPVAAPAPTAAASATPDAPSS